MGRTVSLAAVLLRSAPLAGLTGIALLLWVPTFLLGSSALAGARLTGASLVRKLLLALLNLLGKLRPGPRRRQRGAACSGRRAWAMGEGCN